MATATVTATTMILEAGPKSYRIPLQEPWTIERAIAYFQRRNRRYAMIALSGGVLRVTL